MALLDRRRRYRKGVEPFVELDWLKLTALVSGTFTFKLNRYAPGTMTSISYSIDGGRTWVTSNGTSNIVTPTIAAGNSVYFKGTGTATAINSTDFYHFASTGNFDVSGNIMSLLYGDNFEDQTTLPSNYAFADLFYKSYVKDASGLKLPAKRMTQYCYSSMFALSRISKAPAIKVNYAAFYSFSNMFQNCTMLTAAPSLEISSLEINCCSYMFRGCTALTSAPSSLNSTTLYNGCYSGMFYDCTNLTTAPTLPATKLVSNCYQNMFYNCSKLAYIKAMFTTTPSTSTTNNWVYGVKASGTFVKNRSATWNVTGVHGIPSGWTVQTASS